MKTFTLENLSVEEISAITAGLQYCLSGVKIEEDEIIEAFRSALQKTLHPKVVEDKATSLS